MGQAHTFPALYSLHSCQLPLPPSQSPSSSVQQHSWWRLLGSLLPCPYFGLSPPVKVPPPAHGPGPHVSPCPCDAASGLVSGSPHALLGHGPIPIPREVSNAQGGASALGCPTAGLVGHGRRFGCQTLPCPSGQPIKLLASWPQVAAHWSPLHPEKEVSGHEL